MDTDNRRDITIDTIPGPRTQSRLVIKEPQITDSGNYTCRASNTEPASIFVYVSKGEIFNIFRKLRASKFEGIKQNDFIANTDKPIYIFRVHENQYNEQSSLLINYLLIKIFYYRLKRPPTPHKYSNWQRKLN